MSASTARRRPSASRSTTPIRCRRRTTCCRRSAGPTRAASTGGSPSSSDGPCSPRSRTRARRAGPVLTSRTELGTSKDSVASGKVQVARRSIAPSHLHLATDTYLRLVFDLAPDNGPHDLHVLDLVLSDRVRIVGEDDVIGEFARGDRSLDRFLA